MTNKKNKVTNRKKGNIFDGFDSSLLTIPKTGVNVTGGPDLAAITQQGIGKLNGLANASSAAPSIPGGGGAASAMGLASGAISIGTDIASNLKVPKVENQAISAGSNDELMSAFDSYNPIKLGRNSVAGSALKDGMAGASAGMSFGPVGAGIGAGVGLLAGGISAMLGNKARANRETELQSQQNRNFGAKANQIEDASDDKVESQYFAQGGPLSSGSAQFGNGVNAFNNGGTHEQNPLGGIPQGIGQNNQPNLVEEGEVKFNDYIYSNRLTPSEKILKDLGLPTKYKGKTFGDIANKISKESEERPNDPISKNGLNDTMNKLKGAQELLKAQKEQRKQHAFANQQLTQQFAKGGKLTSTPISNNNFWGYKENNYTPEYTKAVDNVVNNKWDEAQQYMKSKNVTYASTPETFKAAAYDKKVGEVHKYIKAESDSLLVPSNPTNTHSYTHTTDANFYNSGQMSDEEKAQYDPNTLTRNISKEEFDKAMKTNDPVTNSIGAGYRENTFAKGGELPQGIEPNMEQMMQQVAAWIQQGMSPQQVIRQLVTAGIPAQQAQQLVQQVAVQQQAQQQSPQGQGLQLPGQMPGQMMAFGGNIFATKGQIDIRDNRFDNMSPLESDGPVGINIDKYAHDNGILGITSKGALAQPMGINEAVAKDTSRVTYGQGVKTPTTPSFLNDSNMGYLRYAPAVGSGIATLTDALGVTNKPDYEVANTVGGLKVKGERLDNYMGYTPMDREYYQNKLNANSAATRSGLANASGGNRATLAAGLLGADYNYGENMGNLAQKAEEYNLGQRQKVEDFNRGTNQFNAQQSNWEQGINNEMAYKGAMLKDQAKNNSLAAKNNNRNNFIGDLGNIGKEAVSRQMIASNPALYYKMLMDGSVAYKNKKKNGGQLKKKGIDYGF